MSDQTEPTISKGRISSHGTQEMFALRTQRRNACIFGIEQSTGGVCAFRRCVMRLVSEKLPVGLSRTLVNSVWVWIKVLFTINLIIHYTEQEDRIHVLNNLINIFPPKVGYYVQLVSQQTQGFAPCGPNLMGFRNRLQFMHDYRPTGVGISPGPGSPIRGFDFPKT